jgi:hypothetical protein
MGRRSGSCGSRGGTGAIVGRVWAAEEIAGAPAGGEAPITLQLGADGRAIGRGGYNVAAPTPSPATRSTSAAGDYEDGLRARPMDQEQRYFDTLAQVIFVQQETPGQDERS